MLYLSNFDCGVSEVLYYYKKSFESSGSDVSMIRLPVFFFRMGQRYFNGAAIKAARRRTFAVR